MSAVLERMRAAHAAFVGRKVVLDGSSDVPSSGDLIEFLDDRFTDKGPATGTVDVVKTTVDGLYLTVKFSDAQESFSWDDISSVTHRSESGKIWQVGGRPVLDDASSLARVQIASQLVALIAKYRGASDLPAVERLRLVKQIRDMVAQLGGGAVASREPESIPLATLRKVAEGANDGMPLPDLLELITKAVEYLSVGESINAETGVVIKDAIRHWANLEDKANE